MNAAKLAYICIVIAVVHCETTLKMLKQVKQIVNNNSTVSNVTEKSFIDGKSYYPDQTDINFKNPLLKLNANTNISDAHGRRRTVLIINKPMLRTEKVKGQEKAESLLFEEYNDDGSKLISITMVNLDDVAKFFEEYLHTDVCHTYCDPDRLPEQ